MGVEPIGPAPDWTLADQSGLLRFLESETGIRLRARWRAVEFYKYQEAGQDPMHTAHSASRVRGFTDARLWFESLSRTSCDMGVTGAQPAPDGEPAQNTDKLRPEGEAELLERWSP